MIQLGLIGAVALALIGGGFYASGAVNNVLGASGKVYAAEERARKAEARVEAAQRQVQRRDAWIAHSRILSPAQIAKIQAGIKSGQIPGDDKFAPFADKGLN